MQVAVTDDSGTDTLETKLYIGSTTLVTTTAFDPSSVNDLVNVDFLLVSRAASSGMSTGLRGAGNRFPESAPGDQSRREPLGGSPITRLERRNEFVAPLGTRRICAIVERFECGDDRVDLRLAQRGVQPCGEEEVKDGSVHARRRRIRWRRIRARFDGR